MRTLKEHPFFQAVDKTEQLYKENGIWSSGRGPNRHLFFKALKIAKPFIFDRNVTIEKRFAGRSMDNVETLVEDFSIPFAQSLYLMTDCPTILHPPDKFGLDTTKLLGYLVDEIDPENFRVFEMHWLTSATDKKMAAIVEEVGGFPLVNQFTIGLKTIAFAFRSARAMDIKLFDRSNDAHFMRETAAVMEFTKCVSVKRIGVEVSPKFTIKTKGMGAGVTSIKYDNIIHIADKEEYEYVKPLDDSSINWDFRGFWRGHWRAFYSKGVKDQFGRNVVDYGRMGKNRAGVYNVPGYTWVSEHTKGDPRLAEIKVRTVKHG